MVYEQHIYGKNIKVILKWMCEDKNLGFKKNFEH